MRQFIASFAFGLAFTILFCGTSFAEPATDEKKALSESVSLPPPAKQGGMPLFEALNNRKTTRSFDSSELSRQMVSNLLWSAFGVNRPDGKRTAPSAMNAREIDLYVATKDGLFLYEAEANALKRISSRDIRKDCGIQEFHAIAPVVLILVADRSRMQKMSEADRDHYSWCDAGFISQNIYLFCASEKLATVVCGWVDRKALEPLMGLTSDQKVILSQPVGHPAKKDDAETQ